MWHSLSLNKRPRQTGGGGVKCPCVLCKKGNFDERVKNSPNRNSQRRPPRVATTLQSGKKKVGQTRGEKGGHIF